MIIGLEGFGSIWSVRNGSTEERAAFYNTMGIVTNGKLRHRSRVFGQLRFNAIGGFNRDHIERNLGRVFQSAGVPEQGRALLLHHLSNGPERPDFYLFTVTPERTGAIEIDRSGWKSDAVALVSFSQFRDQQEAMLLIPAHGWIRGAPSYNFGGLGTMGFQKGSITLSPARDVPFLLQVLHSRCVTHDQLFEFMFLAGVELKRASFN